MMRAKALIEGYSPLLAAIDEWRRELKFGTEASVMLRLLSLTIDLRRKEEGSTSIKRPKERDLAALPPAEQGACFLHRYAHVAASPFLSLSDDRLAEHESDGGSHRL
jgi:hypothetical protein